MGEGEEVKTRSDPEVEIQERGEIFFFYRPKVDETEAHSPEDVQKMYIVLRPESGKRPVEQKQSPRSGKEAGKEEEGKLEAGKEEEDKLEAGKEEEDKEAKSPSTDDKSSAAASGNSEGGHGVQEVNIEEEVLLRFIVMGKKSLPDPSKKKGRPYWGFVEMVTTKIDHVKDALKGEEYDTSTRGHRHRPPARAVGEGVYRILNHKSQKTTHTHLIYKLEFPSEEKPNEPQESLNIEREGSFIIQIKNPDQNAGSFGGIRKKRKATFPAHLQGQFGKKRYCSANPPDFLNYEGCEFLLISASDDIDEELGVLLKEDHEGVVDSSCSDLVRTFGETSSTAPLFDGTWA